MMVDASSRYGDDPCCGDDKEVNRLFSVILNRISTYAGADFSRPMKNTCAQDVCHFDFT